jgi:hypothetical protein
MKIKEIIEEYKYQSEYINNLNVTKSENVKALSLGYIIALLIVLAPVIITAHFFIYSFYYNLVLAILLVLATAFLSLGEIFHHKILKQYSKDKRTVSLIIKHIIDTVAYLLMFSCSYLFVLLLF